MIIDQWTVCFQSPFFEFKQSLVYLPNQLVFQTTSFWPHITVTSMCISYIE